MSKRKPYQFGKPEKGKVLWTSLEAKADPVAFEQRAAAEFADSVDGADGLKVQRRTFLSVASAAGALLGLEGCVRRPEEKILPFAKQPEYVVPGVAMHYATAVRSAGEVLGLLVTSHEGRPTKVEGNPQHPSSLGATDGYAQALVLDLYDPDRSPAPAVKKGETLADTTFAEVDKALAELAGKAGTGARLRVLAQPSQSPTFVRVQNELLAKFPEAKVYCYEPVSAAARQQGARIAFGQPLDVSFNFRRARTIVALDADFLGAEPGSVRANREFADGRRLSSPSDNMNRLYAVEPGFTVTGATADHRLRLAARDVGAYLKALAAELVEADAIKDPEALPGNEVGDSAQAPFSYEALRVAVRGAKAPAGVPESWVKAVAKELADAQGRGRSLILVGTRQPAEVHALAFVINHALGNVGRTVQLVPALVPSDGPLDGIVALAKDIQGGGVDTLLILGGNPVLEAPADLKFAELLGKVPTSIHLSEFRDETSSLTTWHIPRAHAFESWGDLRGSDGSFSIQQPLIAPLRGGRTDAEILALLAGTRFWRAHPLVRTTVREAVGGDNFELQWKSGLHLGLVRDLTTQSIADVRPDSDAVASALRKLPEARTALGPTSLEVNFAPDPALYDGRHANNPWMLELPDPLSCVSWDNAAYVSPETAKALGIQNQDVVAIKGPTGESVEIVAWVLPGQADNTVTLHLGWGRTKVGRFGEGAGFNVYPLRTTQAFGFGEGFTVSKTLARYKVSQTQETHSMQGRPIAIDATFEEYKKDPQFAEFRSPTLSTLPLWTEVKYEDARWAMSIDLNVCTGCKTCLVACQAENNVSSVGKEQIARGRDMYWLRLDRYFVGESENDPQVAFQPVGCQHCEEAPCENVCPVNATAHSPEGLNDMAYNRCIGTRYCMNNCPYKVRRFNFLDFVGQVPETRRMQYNPNVSVRMRGVMEKCSYCVQRIQEAKIASRRDRRKLRDGEIKTACQQACPTGAIVFGDLNDPSSRVAKLTKLDRQYKLLPEVGAQPRTSFLAKIRNPNPELRS